MELSEALTLRLARELAMDVTDYQSVLTKLGISDEQWQELQTDYRFQAMLKEMVQAWNSAMNTPERVKFKSAGMLEEALEEIYDRIHDHREPLSAKTELLKLVSRLAGIGNERVEGQVNERFVLSINIGDGVKHQLGVTTQKVIEHET